MPTAGSVNLTAYTLKISSLSALRPQPTGKPQAGGDVIEHSLPDGGLPGLGQDLRSPAATASRARQQCVPPVGLPFCRPVVHGLDRHLNRAATSTRPRPSTSAAPPATAPPPARPATTSAHPPPAHSHTVNEPEPKAFRISRKSIRPDQGRAARGSPRTGVRVHALPSAGPGPRPVVQPILLTGPTSR